MSGLVAFFAGDFAGVFSVTATAAVARRGRDSAAVVSNSLPRLDVTVAGTAGPSERVEALAGVAAVAFGVAFDFFLGGIASGVVKLVVSRQRRSVLSIMLRRPEVVLLM